MEDSHITKYDEDVSIFGVFDGHGGTHVLTQVLNAPSLLQGISCKSFRKINLLLSKNMKKLSLKHSARSIR